jgi:hypothetical protein
VDAHQTPDASITDVSTVSGPCGACDTTERCVRDVCRPAANVVEVVNADGPRGVAGATLVALNALGEPTETFTTTESTSLIFVEPGGSVRISNFAPMESRTITWTYHQPGPTIRHAAPFQFETGVLPDSVGTTTGCIDEAANTTYGPSCEIGTNRYVRLRQSGSVRMFDSCIADGLCTPYEGGTIPSTRWSDDGDSEYLVEYFAQAHSLAQLDASTNWPAPPPGTNIRFSGNSGTRNLRFDTRASLVGTRLPPSRSFSETFEFNLVENLASFVVSSEPTYFLSTRADGAVDVFPGSAVSVAHSPASRYNAVWVYSGAHQQNYDEHLAVFGVPVVEDTWTLQL